VSEAFAEAGIQPALGTRLWVILQEAGLRPLGMLGIQPHFGPDDPGGITGGRVGEAGRAWCRVRLMRSARPASPACDGHRAVGGEGWVFEKTESLVQFCLGDGIGGEEMLSDLLHGQAQPCRSGAGGASLDLVHPAFGLDVEQALAEQVGW
jgi:hypothetical protein